MVFPCHIHFPLRSRVDVESWTGERDQFTLLVAANDVPPSQTFNFFQLRKPVIDLPSSQKTLTMLFFTAIDQWHHRVSPTFNLRCVI